MPTYAKVSGIDFDFSQADLMELAQLGLLKNGFKILKGRMLGSYVDGFASPTEATEQLRTMAGFAFDSQGIQVDAKAIRVERGSLKDGRRFVCCIAETP